jgi:Arc/MetJ family transcription regulator
MRTTLNLSETLIADLMKVSGVKTKTEAIHLAISEFIRQKKLAKLRGLSGKLRIDLE